MDYHQARRQNTAAAVVSPVCLVQVFDKENNRLAHREWVDKETDKPLANPDHQDFLYWLQIKNHFRTTSGQEPVEANQSQAGIFLAEMKIRDPLFSVRFQYRDKERAIRAAAERKKAHRKATRKRRLAA